MAIEGCIFVCEKEGGVDLLVFAGGEVAPDGLGRAGGVGDLAILVAFAVFYVEAAVGQVGMPDFQGAEFGGPDAGVEQGEDDGTVTNTVGEGVVGSAFTRAGIFFGAVKDTKHPFDVEFGVGDDFGFFGAGNVDLVEDVFIRIAVGCQPGPEGSEVDMASADGGRADIAERCQEFLYSARGDGVEGRIFVEVLLKEPKCSGIVILGGFGEGEGGGELVAFEGV